MTEQEFLASDDPAALLAWLRFRDEPVAQRVDREARVSDRQLRLFAVACCRQVWHLLVDARCRNCVEAAERYADDPSAVITPFYDDAAERFEEMDAAAEVDLWQATLAHHVCNVRSDFAKTVGGSIIPLLLRRVRVSGKVIATLLRSIIGNPFRPVAWRMPADAHVRSDLYGLAYGMAKYAYEERDWTGLPALADCLEDAGCAEEAVLRHLRGEEWGERVLGQGEFLGQGVGWIPLRGPYIRGCWSVDLCLNKE